MRGLSELVFSTTNRCTARCSDCPVVPNDDPPRRLKLSQMMCIVDEVEGWGSLGLVVFTGGESFLLGADLPAIVEYVSTKRISTRIVTNAYWAKSKNRALRLLGEMKAAGLTELNVSCDDYHQQFVPLENIKHANEAAAEHGLPLLLVHRHKAGGKITVKFLSEYLGVDLTVWRPGADNPPNYVITTSPNIPIRTSGEMQSQDGRGPAVSDARSHGWDGACRSVLKNIVVFPDLSVKLCCGIALCSIPELTIGSLAETDLLTVLRNGNHDLIANWLALEGPSSILDFVREKRPTLALPGRFVGRCHLCNELFTRADTRTILAEHAAERVEKLVLMRGVLDWVGDRLEAISD